MKHDKSMGIVAMLCLLVAVIVILPIVVRYIDKNEPFYVSKLESFVSGEVQPVQQVAAPERYDRDANTTYMCNSPNGSGQSCPEGTFCDGTTQSCVKSYAGGEVPSTGYFS